MNSQSLNQNLKNSSPYGNSNKFTQWKTMTTYEKLHLTVCKK